VQSGNTLSKLAQAHKTSVAAIRQANNLTSDRIRVGQKLIMPAAGPREEDADFTGRQRWVYQELRDRKVALFVDKLPEGVWQIRYDLRAEVPGEFHALPVVGHAMYVPEIRCNGEELRVKVTEAQP
jgi:LysM repeat protein